MKSKNSKSEKSFENDKSVRNIAAVMALGHFQQTVEEKTLNICTNGSFKRTVYSRGRKLLIQHEGKKVPARKCWQYVLSSVVTESYQGDVLMAKMDLRAVCTCTKFLPSD